MKTFEVGDFALIVAGSASLVNIGRTVLLVECLGMPRTYEWLGKHYTNIKQDVIWIIDSQGDPLVTRFGDCATRGPISQSKLMPLRGDFQPEREKQQEQPA